MKNKLLTFLPILLITQTLFSYDIVDVFKNDIHKNFLQYTANVKMVRHGLNTKASVNPDLIYFYLKYIDLLFEGTKPDSVTLYYNYIAELESESIKAYNDWIHSEMELLEKAETDFYIKKKIKKIYKSNLIKTNEGKNQSLTTINTDRNQVDYLVTKYYHKDPDLEYNSDIDYALMRDNYEAKILIQIKDALSTFSIANLPVHNSDFKILFNHAYLLIDPFVSTNIKPHKYFIEAYEYQLSNSNYTNRQVSVLYRPNISTDFNFRISHAGDNNFFIKINLTSHNTNNFYGSSFKFKYWLNIFAVPLSYISVESMFSIGKNFTEFHQGQFEYLSIGDPNYFSPYYEIINIISNDVTIDNIYLAEVKITTPVYLRLKLLTIEIGSTITYKMVEYDLSYQYYWYVEEWNSVENIWYTDAYASGLVERKIREDEMQFTPVIDINLNTPFSKTIFTTSISINYLSFQIGYEL